MKNLIKLSVVFLILISFAFIQKNEKTTIVIDAGHGGSDLGAMLNGLSEKEIVSSIAQKIQNLNTNPNIEVILTRNDDQLVSLEERVAFINAMKPDLVISLHANFSKNIDLNGMEVYVSEKSSEYLASKDLANKFSTSILNKFPIKINPIKFGNFFLFKKSDVPAILIELGYLSNLKDKSFLVNRDSQIEIAENILRFAANIKS